MNNFLIRIKTRVITHFQTALFLHKTANEIILKQETILIVQNIQKFSRNTSKRQNLKFP